MADDCRVTCTDCGTIATDDPVCSQCGSRNRKVEIALSAEEIFPKDSLRASLRDPALKSDDKERVKIQTGWNKYEKTGEWNQVDRLYDRDNDRYVKVIRNAAGEEIERVEKRLSEHQGHGSAKWKKPKP